MATVTMEVESARNGNRQLTQWVEEMARMCRPDQI